MNRQQIKILQLKDRKYQSDHALWAAFITLHGVFIGVGYSILITGNLLIPTSLIILIIVINITSIAMLCSCFTLSKRINDIWLSYFKFSAKNIDLINEAKIKKDLVSQEKYQNEQMIQKGQSEGKSRPIELGIKRRFFWSYIILIISIILISYVTFKIKTN